MISEPAQDFKQFLNQRMGTNPVKVIRPSEEKLQGFQLKKKVRSLKKVVAKEFTVKRPEKTSLERKATMPNAHRNTLLEFDRGHERQRAETIKKTVNFSAIARSNTV